MAIRFQKTVLSSKKLGNEVLIAFGLILLTLLVFLGYLYPGAASSLFSSRNSLHYVVPIAVVIIIFGFFIIIQIVEPVIKISREAKMIAGGDLTRQIKLVRDDEVGELGNALNVLTRRIRENLEELQTLSQKTETLNHEIETRIAVLANLMDISNQIAQKAPLNEVLDTVVKKCLANQRMSFGCIILRDRLTNQFKIQYLSEKKKEILLSKDIKNTNIQLGQGLLGKALLKQTAVVVDSRTPPSQEVEEFKGRFLIRNALIVPISSKGNAYGLLIAGNDQTDFVCTETEKELLQLIAKHVAIAALNEVLSKEIEHFEVTDNLTGLYNNSFARNRLNFEIQQARNSQKPCSFILVDVDHFEKYNETAGHIKAENALIKIAAVLKELIDNENDKAARFADHEFALILSGSNKKEAIALAQEVVKKIKTVFSQDKDTQQHLTVTAAVVENPLDGITAEELILKSGVLLADAREQGGNRVGYQV